MRYLITALALLGITSCALADDIVTMPTANQLKATEVDVAGYYIKLDLPDGAPRHVWYQTLYLGLTDRIELDIHRAEVDRDETSTVFVAQYKALNETPTRPDLVFGVRNFLSAATTKSPLRDFSQEPSAYVCAAKTYFLKSGVQGPPLVRVHVGLGTRDFTLMNEKRHEVVFGGLQFLIVPTVGAVVQHDSRDIITAITYMPLKSGLTFKGGTYGEHTWCGIAYRRPL